MSSRLRRFILASASCVVMASTANAQSVQNRTPNTTSAPGATSVTLGGTTFTNQGLIGAGRLDANTRDFAGETLGSFSGMAFDIRSWRRNPDGTYSGRLFTLPDRGPNDVGPFVGTTDYRNRVHLSTITLNATPVTSALPQSTASQNQVTITPAGGFLLTDTTGAFFTGRDALNNVITRGGLLFPSPASGEGAGRISLDSEGITFRRDGSFYISDEYAANLYYFNANGQLIGAINTVNALSPRIAGAVNFNGAVAPATGRRNNQGLEAVTVTPDNKKLVTILQSATVQDTNGAAQETRNNTRILIYDIANNPTPTAPIGHYVLQLPQFTLNGAGGPVDRTAAQSEALALNDTQFLVLARDGNGRGVGTTNPPVFKSVLLVDIGGATNLAGTAYETGTTPVAVGGNLVAGITPVRQVELVNLLNPVQLGRFGLNLGTAPTSQTTISEKIEALGLVPVLEEAHPQDFFLFVGNDNDFEAQNGFINGQPFNAALTNAGGSGSGNNDSVLLVYRLTLPTYVDPFALEALELTTPAVLLGTRVIAADLAAAASEPAMGWLDSQRSLGSDGRKLQFWGEVNWTRVGARSRALTGLRAESQGANGGLDLRLGTAHVGVSGGYREIDGRFGLGAPVKAKAAQIGGYAGIALPAGGYAQVSGGVSLGLRFDQIDRFSAYGLTASGTTKGDAYAASGELGWQFGSQALSAGPFVAADYVDLNLDAYTETGASLGNVAYATRDYRRLRGTAGIEARGTIGGITPAIRAGYAIERGYGDDAATVRLASAEHALGTQRQVLAQTERDVVVAGGRLDMRRGALTGRVAAEGRWGEGSDDARVTLGFAIGF